MQENNIYENVQKEMFLKYLERQRVKKSAMQIGIAYLLLLFIPMICNYLFVWSSSFLKFNIPKVLSEPAFQNMWQIAVSMAMMLIPAVFIIKTDREKTGEMISFDKPKKGLFLPFVFIGVGVCAFANIATNLFAVILEEVGIYYSSPQLTKPDGFFGIIIIILSTSVTPALVEELLMRGAVLGSVKPYGEDLAVIVSAFLFGLMHMNILQIPFAFIVGLILGISVIKSGSIWTGMAIHFINNFMSVLIADILPVGNSETLRNGITTIYFAISLALAFVGVLMLRGKEKEALRLDRGELKASFKEKLGWFISSPAIIISIVLSVLMTAGIF